jgi:hypothetical protein
MLSAQEIYTIHALYGDYDEDPKSYYLRVNFNFVDRHVDPGEAPWWIAGGFDWAEEAARGLDNLNQAFNPHGIYFLADTPTPDCSAPATYQLFAGLQNPQGKSLFNLIREDYQTSEEISRALNIYITSDQGVSSGYNYTLPGNWLTIKGTEDGKLATRSATLEHVVGHALGLLDTSAGIYHEYGECDEEGNPEPVGYCPYEEELCYCCGDYVCDTDYTLNNNIILDSVGCFGSSSIPQSVRLNYMSNVTPGSCRNTFTEEQGRRVKKYLRELHRAPYGQSLLLDVQFQEGKYPGVIPSGITGNFTVESGVLVLDSPLQMLPGATITVKTGAVLHIKSTLTSACDKMWQGIKVESGGIVKVFGQGVIEHAVCGLDVVGNSSEVSIFGGTLMNNTIGLRVDANDAVETNNQVFFANFELDDQYKGASDERPYFIVLRGNRGTRIRSATFADERTADCSDPNEDCPWRAIGIAAEEAGFFCRANTTFSKLYTGIQVSNLGIQQGSFRVSDCTFSKNTKGIISNFCSSFEIQDNLFEMDSDEHPTYFNAELPIDKSCIEIFGAAQGFTISGNTFVRLGESSEDCSYYGTICTATGHGLDNEIINNDYVQLEVGNAARLNNGNEHNGLVYRCNNHRAEPSGINPDFENCADYLIEPGATIRKEQHGVNEGNAVAPAGNVFSSSTPIINQSGEENPDDFYAFNYYYALGVPNQDPGSPNGVTAIGLDATPGCEVTGCPPPCHDHPLPGLKVLYRQAQNNAKAFKASARSSPKQPTLKRSPFSWEQQRRRTAGQILRHYALDTTSVEADSIRQWLYNANTFGSLYLLAREQFLFGEMSAFQVLWERIPQLIDLTPYQASTYSDLSALFNILKPYLAEGGDLRELPKSLIEGLYSFTVHCNEAGFLSAALLQRNGVEATVPCNGQSPALAQKGSPERQAQNIRRSKGSAQAALFPNPTTGTLVVVLPKGVDKASMALYNLEGQPVFQAPLAGPRTTLHLPVPSGIYLVRLQITGQQPEHHKIVVSR